MRLIEKPSMLTRLFVGKTTGAFIGLIVLIALPVVYADASWPLRLGFFFWYTTVGAFIAVMGVLDRHPLIPRWRFPWWFLGPFIGAWLNFLLSLFAPDEIHSMVAWFLGDSVAYQAWFALDGAITGAIIAYLATRCGGEGPLTVNNTDLG